MFKAILVIVMLGAANAASTGSTCSGTDPLFMSNPADCSTYYICAGGVYVLQKCAGGLIWDSTISNCNFATAVKNGCSSEPEVPGPEETTTRGTTTTTTTTTAKPGVPEETTTKGTTSTTKAPVPPPSGGDLTCPTSEGYNYYGISGSCTQFYLCSKGTPSGPFNCGAGLSFSQNSQSCVRPEKSEC